MSGMRILLFFETPALEAGVLFYLVGTVRKEGKSMNNNITYFTSESVTEGHPDKLCDQISDAVLDAVIAQDPNARVACETAAASDMVLIMGEITADAPFDAEKIARSVILDVGYDDNAKSFDGNTCGVMVSLHRQSPDIAMGVDRALESKNGETDELELGAGDQGMVFGYACKETEELMPLPIALAHRLSRRLTDVRKQGILPYLYPDGKTQVTVAYADGKPLRIDTVVVSTQHSADVSMETLRADVLREVILPSLPAEWIDGDTRYLVNPTGRFVVGGPNGDSGLTGRKIIVDTYGGYARHGGGAFSGKDPTKVDRSAAYMARCVAKNLVAAGAAERCEVQIAYAIGVAKPVSVRVDTFGTGVRSDSELAALVNQVFDLRPSAIIKQLDLRRPIYRATSNYGHFGREDAGFAWEQTTYVPAIKQALGL